MAIVIVIGLIVLWFCAVEVVKDRHTKGKHRRDDRIMAAYQRQEEARFHAYDLAAIERTRRAALEELIRVAAEAGGDVIEGTTVEARDR
jgi:hypothetical protein